VKLSVTLVNDWGTTTTADAPSASPEEYVLLRSKLKRADRRPRPFFMYDEVFRQQPALVTA
jgi:hypothetical protein